MKKFLIFLLGVIVGGIALHEAFSQYPYYRTLIVRSYLDVEGKGSVKDSLTLYGRMYGTISLRGTRIFGITQITAANPDTLVIPGYDSTKILVVSMRFQVAADTTIKDLFVKPAPTGDTAFVYQSIQGAAIRKIKYDYIIIR